MMPGSTKGLHFSNEKHFLDDPNVSIQSVRSITFEEWCKKKEIMQRLKDKLVEDAKLKIFEQMQVKEVFHQTQKKMENFKTFSKTIVIFRKVVKS